MKLEFPKLTAEQIECRVGTISEKGLTLLLYKTARTDQDMLDSVVGPMGWQRDHKEIDGTVYCGVGVYDTDLKQWVWKWDAGSEGTIEKEKSSASSSFKRACTNFGIGRELYSTPFIFIKSGSYKAFTTGSGKLATYDKFSVARITYTNDGKIDGLAIKNESTQKVVFMQKPSEEELLDKADKAIKTLAK